jgi:heme/copper-type cytochrome/quinol oxidase subunit 2
MCNRTKIWLYSPAFNYAQFILIVFGALGLVETSFLLVDLPSAGPCRTLWDVLLAFSLGALLVAVLGILLIQCCVVKKSQTQGNKDKSPEERTSVSWGWVFVAYLASGALGVWPFWAIYHWADSASECPDTTFDTLYIVQTTVIAIGVVAATVWLIWRCACKEKIKARVEAAAVPLFPRL